MNSIKSIPISSLHLDDQSFSSKTFDTIQNSWTLQKKMDVKGKTNYKLINESSENSFYKKKNVKHLKKSTHRSIGSFSNPVNNLKNLSTLEIIKSVKRIKNNEDALEKKTNLVKEITEKENPNPKNNVLLDRFVLSENNKIYKDMILGIHNRFINYSDVNDMIQKSLYNGHLYSNANFINSINVILSYSGISPIENMTISIWQLVMYPQFDLMNIENILVKEIQMNKGKYIYKKIEKQISSLGQLFLTFHIQQEKEGKLSMKYNLELTKTEMDDNKGDIFKSIMEEKDKIYFDFDVNNAEDEEPKKEKDLNIIETPIETPKLSKNIFGDFIKQVNQNNIPIFSDKKDEMSESNSIRTRKNISNIIYDNEDYDFTEKDSNDVKNILSILKNQ